MDGQFQGWCDRANLKVRGRRGRRGRTERRQGRMKGREGKEKKRGRERNGEERGGGKGEK